jgi:hypothetical protein
MSLGWAWVSGYVIVVEVKQRGLDWLRLQGRRGGEGYND